MHCCSCGGSYITHVSISLNCVWPQGSALWCLELNTSSKVHPTNERTTASLERLGTAVHLPVVCPQQCAAVFATEARLVVHQLIAPVRARELPLHGVHGAPAAPAGPPPPSSTVLKDHALRGRVSRQGGGTHPARACFCPRLGRYARARARPAADRATRTGHACARGAAAGCRSPLGKMGFAQGHAAPRSELERLNRQLARAFVATKTGGVPHEA
eukprot:scaffold8346_cov119-Isochrysis_galbana.AAC.13